MAVPKKRPSHARTYRRKRANEKRSLVTIGVCPTCESPVLPHHACPSCGYYKGQEVIPVLAEKEKEKKKKEKRA
ncbi:MAG: 50S ribosomal protein L32 [Spirochaetes bacterium]|nr:50S ribosomal protein L32 [Spirochaetota bacterium]MBP8991821.1 50S ribosomal protein L32 [Spirochaetota bacterium]NLJ04436.1 50S ribosomal protein L32 [Exilispira sp.]HOV46746.1 50S ribosomal protein L32 [Exilispira sp.]HPO60360.1 50S ribosomal protein L32 [Exilispira sp.]